MRRCRRVAQNAWQSSMLWFQTAGEAIMTKPGGSIWRNKFVIVLQVVYQGDFRHAVQLAFPPKSVRLATASERTFASWRSTARSAAERKIWRNPLGPTPTSRSPARTTKIEVRKKAMALTPAVRICAQRDADHPVA